MGSVGLHLNGKVTKKKRYKEILVVKSLKNHKIIDLCK